MFIYEMDKIDYKKLHIYIDGIDHDDYPDYCDAFCYAGDYDGRELTDAEIDYINDELSSLVYERVVEYIF